MAFAPDGPMVLNYGNASSDSARLGIAARIFLAIAAVPLPALGLMLADFISPGNLRDHPRGWTDYFVLMLDHRVAWPFYSLAAFAAAAMVYLIWIPRRAVSRGWVQAGILVGALINLHYVIVVSAYLTQTLEPPAYDLLKLIFRWRFALLLVVLLIPSIGMQLRPVHWRSRPTIARLMLAWGATWALTSLIFVIWTASSMAMWVAFVVACAPLAPWIAYSAAWTYVRLCGRNGGCSLRERDVAVAYGSGYYVAALVPALTTALVRHDTIYAMGHTLCFIATAAARGHPRVVKATRVRIDGHPILINDQLRYLICAELALRHRRPAVQRALRAAYNRIGPRLATRIADPLAADFAYLLLKPLEYLARVYLASACPGLDVRALMANEPCIAGARPSSIQEIAGSRG